MTGYRITMRNDTNTPADGYDLAPGLAHGAPAVGGDSHNPNPKGPQ